MRNPERLIGAHFFSGARHEKLLKSFAWTKHRRRFWSILWRFQEDKRRRGGWELHGIGVNECFSVHNVRYYFGDLGCDPRHDRVISMSGPMSVSIGRFSLNSWRLRRQNFIGSNQCMNRVDLRLDAKRLGEKTRVDSTTTDANFARYGRDRAFIENARKNRKVSFKPPEQLGFARYRRNDFFPVVNEACEC